MNEHGFDRTEAPISPPQPHFDDERTMLSARPVVPLKKIDAKLRHRRRWFIGGAFAIAMMLGAASALVASYLKLRTVSNSGNEISQVETASPQPVEAETVASELPVEESVEEPVVLVETKKTSTVKRRTVMTPDPPSTQPEVSEEDELRRIREAVLYEEWQERRLRRATRRERRSRADRQDRDLSNLDEIFEGRRRPQ